MAVTRPDSSQHCRFYNSSSISKVCDAGVVYSDVTPNPELSGSHFRQPCIGVPNDAHGLKVLRETGPQGTCGKYAAYTAEEYADREAKMEAWMAREMARMDVTDVLAAEIKKQYAGQDWAGVRECPVCKGVLHVTHSGYNGHMSVSCETEDCIRWME